MQPGASLFPVIDGHVDLVYEMMRRHEGARFEDLADGPVTAEKLNAGNVRLIVSALYCPDSFNGPDASRLCLNRLFEYTDIHIESILHVKTAGDLHRCWSEDGAPGFILLLENADSLVDGGLDELHERAVKVVGLTHAGTNRIGDGNGVPFPEGLTRAGRELVRILESENFAIDVAHLSDRSFSDLVRIYDGPILSSHTGFRFFCDKPRNLDFEHIRILVERCAVIGVSINPEMLSVDNRAGIDEVYQHIDWVAQKYGPQYVALGSDFGGFDDPNLHMPDISNLSKIADVLILHGYPADAVSAILGENWRRFYASLLAHESSALKNASTSAPLL